MVIIDRGLFFTRLQLLAVRLYDRPGKTDWKKKQLTNIEKSKETEIILNQRKKWRKLERETREKSCVTPDCLHFIFGSLLQSIFSWRLSQSHSSVCNPSKYHILLNMIYAWPLAKFLTLIDNRLIQSYILNMQTEN